MAAPSQLQVGLIKGLAGGLKGYTEGYDKESSRLEEVNSKKMMQQALDARKKEEDALKWERESVPNSMLARLALEQTGVSLPEEGRSPISLFNTLSDNRLKEKASKGGRGGLGFKLNPDQRYNESSDTVEAIPGSKLYLQQADRHKKDSLSLFSSKSKADIAKKKVSDILGDPKAMRSQFGGYEALAGRFLHPDAKVKIDSLKSNLMASGLDIMKNGGGIGQITEREWPIMEKMIANLSPTMSEDEAKRQLEFINQKFESIVQEAQQAYELEWGNTPYAKPMRTNRGGIPPAAPQTGDYSDLWK